MTDIKKYMLSDKEREEWYNDVVRPCFISNSEAS